MIFIVLFTKQFGRQPPQLKLLSLWVIFYTFLFNFIHDHAALIGSRENPLLNRTVNNKATSICLEPSPVQENYQLIWNKLITKCVKSSSYKLSGSNVII